MIVKQRLRDIIAPDKGLGHCDTPVTEAVFEEDASVRGGGMDPGAANDEEEDDDGAELRK
ncbi:hypothetical protein T484DRAFT_1826645 [Baffinella frigidus]|nr:hypothetical protein T484DRAFT_1826645 [Cryptophyta sp. CCMP2293]